MNRNLSIIRHSPFAIRHSKRCGYIYLISVLFVTAIAVSVLSSYLLLSIASLQNGITFQSSAQALENAQSCAEIGLSLLLRDSNFSGNETVSLPDGDCFILQPGGYGNENRTVCTEGSFGNHTRRMEIIVERLLPSVRIYSWQEVASITSCSY